MTKIHLTDMISLNEIVQKTSKRQCLICDVNLDREIGEGRWHVPLCQRHKFELLEEMGLIK